LFIFYEHLKPSVSTWALHFYRTWTK